MRRERKPDDSGSREGKSNIWLNRPQKISFTFHLDESLVADIKLLHIRPSDVLDRELRREIRRRKRLLKEKTKSQIVNRFSGEILPTR